MKFLLDFLAYGFAHSVNYILSYLKLANTEGGKVPGGRAENPVWAGQQAGAARCRAVLQAAAFPLDSSIPYSRSIGR
jgi:hypothetical protein